MKILVFFTLICNLVLSISAFELTPKTCRANIKKIICIVNPMNEDEKENNDILSRKCLVGSSKYVSMFEEAFNYYPWSIQRIFCSLNKIFLEKKTVGTAYAGVNREENILNRPMRSAFLGINKNLLDNQTTLNRWATWKEQTNFIKGPTDLKKMVIDTKGPRVFSDLLNMKNSFLFFVMAHELGHILDFSNYISTNSQETNNTDWSRLSWGIDEKPYPKLDFPMREYLCFYGCENPILKEKLRTLYEQWSKSSFVSLFSSLSSGQEFAEFLAYYVLFESATKGYYIIEIPGSNNSLIFNLRDRFYSSKLRPKRLFIKKLLKKIDLNYPPLTIH